MVPSIRDYLEIRTARPSGFSPSGERVLVGADLSGTVQLYEVPRAGGDLRRLTDLPEPVAGRYLPDCDDVLLSFDEGGDERLRIHRLVAGSGELCPVVSDPGHIARAGGVSRDGRLLAYTSNRRTGADFDVWVRDLRTGRERMVFSPGGWCSAGAFSPDGRRLSVTRLSERPGDDDAYLVAVETGEVVHVSPHDDDAHFSGASWLPDGRAFFFTTNHGREHTAVARYDLDAASWSYVLHRPWDLGCAVDWAGRSLLVVANEDGTSRAELVDPSTLEVRTEVPLPGRGVAGSWSFSADGRFLAYAFASACEPGDAWCYDVETGATTRLTDCPKPVPPASMVEPELHRYRSFDGEEVPVFAYLPPSPPAVPPPVVAVLHGGPEGQFVRGFNPVVQYLVARGYAVVAPNVRGSTGYGRRWEHLDDGRRRLDAVRDLEGLSDWLRSSSCFDADRAVLYGGSYGGYLVLAGLAFQPDRWAAGVSIVGISSLVTFLEGTAEWRRRFREREYGSLATDRDFLLRASPLTSVEAVRAPLFLIHGANDPRVPLGEAQQIHRVLQAKGVPSELALYPDEGHGLGKLANRLDAYPRAVDFLDRVLAARG
ncbi:MAG: prolyl oligopeptidase family serine peptidase [Actinomycetota bacterium]|nr:prolyl oligopeptidase family serine peptidase [Actinomycetota bacterium]